VGYEREREIFGDVVEALVASAYLFSSVLENKHRYNDKFRVFVLGLS
jgi:hypothetical protein